MAIFYLIRHAESLGNAEFAHLVGGRSNHYPLTAKGEWQAEQLAKRFQKEKTFFDHWSASPAIRTQETARIVREILVPDIEMITDDRIQELNQGEWEGKVRSEMFTPEVSRHAYETHPHFKAPGGESHSEKADSMIAFVNELKDAGPDKAFVVFTHGVAIKCLLQRILSSDPKMTIHIAIENTSITQIRYERDTWFIDRVNDYAHITP